MLSSWSEMVCYHYGSYHPIPVILKEISSGHSCGYQLAVIQQGPVAGSMVSSNHRLIGSVKTNILLWYLMPVSASQASSNSSQMYFFSSSGNH